MNVSFTTSSMMIVTSSGFWLKTKYQLGVSWQNIRRETRQLHQVQKKLVSKTKAWVIASLTKTHQLPQLSLFFFDANAVSSQHAHNCLSFSVSMKVKLLSHPFSCLSGGLKAMPKYFSALPSLPFACSFVIPLSLVRTLLTTVWHPRLTDSCEKGILALYNYHAGYPDLSCWSLKVEGP